MYPSRGRRILVSNTDRTPLYKALHELLKMRTGRLVYRSTTGAIFMLEASNDGRAGCLAEVGGGKLRGEECLTMFARRVLEESGTIELVGLTRAEALLDFGVEPASLIPRGVDALRELAELLESSRIPGAEIEEKSLAIAGLEAEHGSLGRAATSVTTIQLPGRVVEHFDPLAAAAIIAKGDRIVFNKPEMFCSDIAREIVEAQTARAVVLCLDDKGKLVILVNRGIITAIYDSEPGGQLLMGRDALLHAARMSARQALVYVLH